MLISYEVPMALAITGVAILAGTLSLHEIVLGQTLPFALVQPLGLIVFLTAASAEMSRSPFDMIEAESELGGGYVTEYAGIKFAILQLAEFMAPLATAAVATVLFLGGTRGFDPIPGPVWFVAKAFALVFLMLWIRATWPRLRVDQIMGFAWKALLPLALVNMFVVAIELVVLQDSESGAITSGDLWTMAAVNWVIAVVAIFAMANVLGQRRLRPETPVPSPLANMTAEAD
jgi:NADH-quinone oxidoreductase subunit H